MAVVGVVDRMIKKKKKSLLLAAVLNFLTLGGGYLYLGKRRALGWIMLLAAIVMTVEFFMGTLGHFSELANTHTPSLTIIAVAVAVDGYLLAKEMNERRKHTK